jgi:hypothetical protein
MLGEGKGVVQNFISLTQFLVGRLAGYLVFAVFAWLLNWSILERSGSKGLLIGVLYIIFSCLLILYAFFKKTDDACAVRRVDDIAEKIGIPFLVPAMAGLLSGIAFCPPLLLAMTDTAASGNLFYSLFFFFMFFIGTSLFFIAIPVVGALRRFQALRVIGKMAAGLAGLYYLYAGIMSVVAGLKNI